MAGRAVVAPAWKPRERSDSIFPDIIKSNVPTLFLAESMRARVSTTPLLPGRRGIRVGRANPRRFTHQPGTSLLLLPSLILSSEGSDEATFGRTFSRGELLFKFLAPSVWSQEAASIKQPGVELSRKNTRYSTSGVLDAIPHYARLEASEVLPLSQRWSSSL